MVAPVLAGIDFSPESELALTTALNVARHTGASVTLVHAVTSVPSPALKPAEAAELYDNHRRRLMAANGERLERLAARRDPAVSVSHVVRHQRPESCLIEEAADIGADLIVVGHRGLTGMQRILLGSTAERVVRLAGTAVLVARGKPPDASGFYHILVPTDFSPASLRALDYAVALIAPGGVIELLHLWEVPFDMGTQRFRDAVRSEAEQRGETLLDDWQHRHDKMTFVHREESVVGGILHRLDEGAYDLVAMGSRGRRGLGRILLGSASEKTVRHAPISVLICH